MSGVLLDPASIVERSMSRYAAAQDEWAARRAQLDLIAYGCRREREVWCFAPSEQVLAQAAVLSILNDRLYADLAGRARKPSPATTEPGDRRPGPAAPRPRGRRRRGRRR